jgi:hypothetical protein
MGMAILTVDALAKLAAAVATVLRMVSEKRTARSKAAASYFRRLGNSLREIEQNFSRNDPNPPSEAGHIFQGLIQQAEDDSWLTESLSIEEVERYFGAVRKASKHAKDIDYHFVQAADRATILRGMRQLVGDLHVIANRLDP